VREAFRCSSAARLEARILEKKDICAVGSERWKIDGLRYRLEEKSRLGRFTVRLGKVGRKASVCCI